MTQRTALDRILEAILNDELPSNAPGGHTRYPVRARTLAWVDSMSVGNVHPGTVTQQTCTP